MQIGKGKSPGGTDVIVPELIRVAGPRWCGSELPRGCRADAWCAASELVMDRIHRVLADAPGVVGTHVSGRRNDNGQRLVVVLLVVSAVPRTVHGKVMRPTLGH